MIKAFRVFLLQRIAKAKCGPKPSNRLIRLADRSGLVLFVQPNGRIGGDCVIALAEKRRCYLWELIPQSVSRQPVLLEIRLDHCGRRRLIHQWRGKKKSSAMLRHVAIVLKQWRGNGWH